LISGTRSDGRYETSNATGDAFTTTKLLINEHDEHNSEAVASKTSAVHRLNVLFIEVEATERLS